MEKHSFEGTHIVFTTSRPFEEVIKTFEDLIGGTPSPDHWSTLFNDLASANASWQQVTEAVTPQIGPSGFICMIKIDLGILLSLQGRKQQVIRYVIGNPLVANRMIAADAEAGLYAPVNVVVYQEDGGQTKIAYDQPSSLLGQFNNEPITTVAQMLGQKLEELMRKAIAIQA